MSVKKNVALLLGFTMMAGVFAGCSGEETKTEHGGSTEAEGETLSGDITVLTNKTDLVDTKFQEYADAFNEKYPNVRVEFEALPDYSDVRIRMNTNDYGDVLLIPDGVALNTLPDYFEPLGTVEEMQDKYNDIQQKAYEGTVYGIPLGMGVRGIVYNKEVFAEAGITEWAKTPEEFIENMKKIKETTGVIPNYTNYAPGWPLSQYEYSAKAIFGDADYPNKMVDMDAPFEKGTSHYITYKLLYDLVKEGLVEEDPFTSDFELSKQMLADGEVATIIGGSWLIPQVASLTDNPENIGIMPFPYQVDGKFHVAAGDNYSIAINKNSENKEAARAWLDFFVEETDFIESECAIPAIKDQTPPEELKEIAEGAEFVTFNPVPAEKAGLIDAIDAEGEIGLQEPNFKQRIIESAIGNTSETYDDIMNDLNERWAAARAEVMKE